jgi:radical SAM superfamily enzyme YgiQ (UPF0313 family)
LKVLLVNPPSFNEIIGNNPVIIEEERGHNPPLGILYIAAHLQESTGHNVSVLDAQVEEIDYGGVESRIRETSPDVVGITAMTLTLLDVIKTIETVKRVDGNIRVVLGGPHVHLFPEETIDLPGVDYLVLGEGEYTFKELLDCIGDRIKLRALKGIVFKDGAAIINTGFRDLIENLDVLPFPARHLVPYSKYSSLMAKRIPITTMFTSRGCPYQCTFCDRPHLGKRFRARSAGNVVDEMQECTRLGIQEFLIYDDTFTVNKRRVVEICDEIISRKLDIGWDIRARINNMDAELLMKLKSANCERIHYGVEAGTDNILKVLNKGITVEQTRKVFRETKRTGISTLAYFMLGSPGETLRDIKKTIKVMKELDPDFAHITVLTPFPGTRIYRDALDRGIIKSDVWREFAKSPRNDFIPPHWGEHFSKEELNNLLVEAYKGFYTRPKYIIKELSKVSSPGEFKRKVKAGLKVLGM